MKNRTVQRSQMEFDIAKLQKLSSWLNYMPELSFTSNWSWSGGTFPESFSMMQDDGSFSYGLSLSWTIISGTSRIAGIKDANANAEQSAISLDKTELSIQQQAREAYRTMSEAAASYELSGTQVSDAELTVNATKKRYELGSATLLELLDAELALEQTQLQKIMALASYYRAKAQMQLLTGE